MLSHFELIINHLCIKKVDLRNYLMLTFTAHKLFDIRLEMKSKGCRRKSILSNSSTTTKKHTQSSPNSILLFSFCFCQTQKEANPKSTWCTQWTWISRPKQRNRKSARTRDASTGWAACRRVTSARSFSTRRMAVLTCSLCSKVRKFLIFVVSSYIFLS